MKRTKRSKTKTPVTNKVNNKDNAPPSNPDQQDISQSMKEFIKLKQLGVTESMEPKKKRRKTTQVIVENPPSNENTNQKSVSLQQNPKVAIRNDKILKLRKKKHNKFQKLKEKRKLKKLQQKKKVTEDIEETMKDLRKEDIKFGEVAHRPPQITVLPRKVTKTGFENRPGRKDDLLLKSILKNSDYSKEKRTPLTDKRKNLSISDRRQIEVERQKAILAYRHMKEKQSKIKN